MALVSPAASFALALAALACSAAVAHAQPSRTLPFSPPPIPQQTATPLDAYADLAGSQNGGLAGSALTVPKGKLEVFGRGLSLDGERVAQLGLAYGASRNVEVWIDGVGIVDDEEPFGMLGGGVKVVAHRAGTWQLSLSGGVRLPGIVHFSTAVTGCLDGACTAVASISGTVMGAGEGEGVTTASGSLTLGSRAIRGYVEAHIWKEGETPEAIGVAGVRVGGTGGALELGILRPLGNDNEFDTDETAVMLAARLRT